MLRNPSLASSPSAATYPAGPVAAASAGGTTAPPLTMISLVPLCIVFGLSIIYPNLLYGTSVANELQGAALNTYYLNTVLVGLSLLLAVATRRVALAAIATFNWLFFIIAPVEQLIRDWDPIYADPARVGEALLYVTVYLLVVLAVALPPVRRSRADPLAAREPAGGLRILVGFGLVFLLDAAILVAFGEAIFSSRHEAGDALEDLSGPAALLLIQFGRRFILFFPLFVLVHQLLDRDRRSLPIIALALFCVLVGILLNNPTTTSRNYLGSLVVGVFLLFAGNGRALWCIGIIVAGAVVAPFFHVFRSALQADKQVQLSLENFASYDYDAFSNIMYAIVYVQQHGMFWGKNILAAVFFFVPRAVWPNKPEGTGRMVMAKVGFLFRSDWPEKISMPIPGEGMVAFGVVGIILLTAACMLIIRWLDTAPLGLGLKARLLSLGSVFVAFCPVSIIFASRGTLINGIAYTTAAFLALTLVWWLTSQAKPKPVAPPLFAARARPRPAVTGAGAPALKLAR